MQKKMWVPVDKFVELPLIIRCTKGKSILNKFFVLSNFNFALKGGVVNDPFNSQQNINLSIHHRPMKTFFSSLLRFSIIIY